MKHSDGLPVKANRPSELVAQIGADSYGKLRNAKHRITRNRQMERQTDRQTDRQASRQTEMLTQNCSSGK